MIQLTDGKWEKLIRFYNVTEEDLEVLHRNHDFFEQHAHEIVAGFYDELMKIPNMREKIEMHSTVENLSRTQTWYLKSLATDTIDDTYIQGRVKVGNVHARINLDATWYLGGYAIYLRAIKKELMNLDIHEAFSVYDAVTRRIMFDSAIILEAYVQDLIKQREKFLVEVSNAYNGLTTSIEQVNAIASEFANSATDLATAQSEVVQSVNALSNQSTEIGSMSELVFEIAAQTHMLGLNASIESARSGEHGRGFSVIAEEIRKLADKSKGSSQDIQSSTKQLVSYINSINTQTEHTMAVSEEQAASAQELSALIENVKTVLEQLKTFSQLHAQR